MGMNGTHHISYPRRHCRHPRRYRYPIDVVVVLERVLVEAIIYVLAYIITNILEVFVQFLVAPYT